MLECAGPDCEGCRGPDNGVICSKGIYNKTWQELRAENKQLREALEMIMSRCPYQLECHGIAKQALTATEEK